jgi:hypothetical protein
MTAIGQENPIKRHDFKSRIMKSQQIMRESGRSLEVQLIEQPITQLYNGYHSFMRQ